MHEDADVCYRAIQARDPRFDGRFVTTVLTTGIFCRPSCPARTPRRENVRFLASPEAAEAAGFRACRRCRPGEVLDPAQAAAALASRALSAVDAGVVDAVGVAGLAQRLNVSPRHLSRVVSAELGVGPLALARRHRADTARLLLEQTALPVTEIAFAAGFASVRQFNSAIRESFGEAPTGLRRTHADTGPGLRLRLTAIHPLDVATLLGWFGARSIPGIEEVGQMGLHRVVPTQVGPAVIELTLVEDGAVLEVMDGDLRAVAELVHRVRGLLDLDADLPVINDTLAADPTLAPALAAAPNTRVPGTVDATELAVRAVVGQQISVAAARTIAGRIATTFGTPLAASAGGLTHVFPTALRLADAPFESVGMIRARAATLRALMTAIAGGQVALGRDADRVAVRAALLELPGIGPWTTEYIALRALGDPDAFPASDLGLLRGASVIGLPTTPRGLLAHAERWRPWRGYAAMHLWQLSSGATLRRNGR